MVNEAVKVELYGNNAEGDLRRYACANPIAIDKGTILGFEDARKASAALTYPVAGIAAMDKEASDGSTSISVWTNGIFELKASGAINAGQKVKVVALNCVAAALDAEVSSSYAMIIGTAQENAATDEVINVRVLI